MFFHVVHAARASDQPPAAPAAKTANLTRRHPSPLPRALPRDQGSISKSPRPVVCLGAAASTVLSGDMRIRRLGGPPEYASATERGQRLGRFLATQYAVRDEGRARPALSELLWFTFATVFTLSTGFTFSPANSTFQQADTLARVLPEAFKALDSAVKAYYPTFAQPLLEPARE
ncbi:hypothetical protein B0H12DRAFT_1068556 [Mycena haematopus]|nr:hypothetical protein B0H12DRAFT_1068556 [Mycena haematopus]